MMNYPYKPGTNPFGYPTAPQPMTGIPTGAQAAVTPPQVSSGAPMTPSGAVVQVPSSGLNVPGQLPAEQSFIENILRLNLGKVATIYMTFENNSQWNAKVFKGKLEAAGRDHIIISDPQTGMRYLLLMVNLDYITFDEPLQYYYPYGQQPQPR